MLTNNLNIVLISPPTETSAGKHASLGGSEHLGLCYIAASLEKANHNVAIKNYEESYCTPEEGVIDVKKRSPVIVGLSPTSYSMTWTIEFCRLLKATTKCYIILGGNMVTHLGRELLENLDNIDFICIGDGEVSVCQIANSIMSGINTYDHINNIVFRDSTGAAVQTPIDHNQHDIDNIIWPKRSFHDRQQSARIIASRGCPYNCSFCTTPTYCNGVIRYRNIDNVVDEMEYLYNSYGIKRFFFSDDIFLDNSQKSIARVQRFSELLKLRLPKIEFRCEFRSDAINNKQLISALYESGMKYVFIGFESSEEADLLRYNKHISASYQANVPKLLRDIGISVVPGYIMFNRDSKLDSLVNKALFLYKNRYLYRTTLLSRTCMGYPGSAYFQDMLQQKTYDIARSSPYVLYPSFKIPEVRTLSIAMEKVELLYSKTDSTLLNSIIYRYEEYMLRNKPITRINYIEQAIETFNTIQSRYLELFQEAIMIARQGANENDILELFSSNKRGIEELSNYLVSQLDILDSSN